MDLHAMKELLANACRVLAFGGQRDGIWGHVTLRLPEGDRFLMKPHEMGLEEIMADDVITVTLDGQKVAGHRKIHSEVPIHAEILRARPDVNCVVHTHPAAPIVFSALGQPMLPISNESCLFFDSLPIYTGTTDLIREPERGRELAACLGQARAALMRNHGIVTVGQTVGEAVMFALFLDEACKKQLQIIQCGGAKFVSSPEEARSKGRKHGGQMGDGRMDTAFAYYVRELKRQGGAA